MSLRPNASAFAGVGQSRLFRFDDVPLGRLAVEAARAAIDDAGLRPSDIDGICCADAQPFSTEGALFDGTDYVSAGFMVEALGVVPTFSSNTKNMIGRSLTEAIGAVESGRCRHALVFRALHSPRGKYGETSASQAEGLAQYTGPYGVFTPATFAQLWHRYRDKYGSGSREQMAALVLQLRENGMKSRFSYWAQNGTEPPDREAYLAARPVSTPLSIYDCDMPVQGAAAFVITSAERARDLRNPPAYIAGHAYPVATVMNRVEDITLEREEHWGRHVADCLWRHSGHTVDDVKLANLYDGFSILTILWLEAMGFCAAGEAFDFIQDGRIAPDGALPLNVSGGNIGNGRMHGAPQIMDAILQVTNRAGACQVAGADTALTTTGQLWGGHALLLRGHD